MPSCSVCKEPFSKEQGLTAHLRFIKDDDHDQFKKVAVKGGTAHVNGVVHEDVPEQYHWNALDHLNSAKRLLNSQIASVETKIAQLSSLREELNRLLTMRDSLDVLFRSIEPIQPLTPTVPDQPGITDVANHENQ